MAEVVSGVKSCASVVQDQRQAAMVRNPEVRLKCDEQTSKAWLRSWERSNATTADFCDSGGAAELAVKALFPQMHCWAAELQVGATCAYLYTSHTCLLKPA